MAKSDHAFVCQACGAVHPRWTGKCDSCGGWNSIVQEAGGGAIPKGLGAKKKGRAIELSPLDGPSDRTYPRHMTGIKEFDRVMGGGLVPGSAILIGGDPGIGKSTLLLQAVCALAKRQARCVYISGEESVDQVRMRAQRLGLTPSPQRGEGRGEGGDDLAQPHSFLRSEAYAPHPNPLPTGRGDIEIASATNVRDILASIETREKADAVTLLVIDSIQTMFIDTVESAPGTVSQVRTSAQEIIRAAKSKGMAVIFVGHVTKDGQIAGPRVLEHMVDTVLYFEGDRSHHFRILRAVKNRFGPTDEIGVFEMAGVGLQEVENPSALFLSQRHGNVAGSAVLAALEGTRPLLVEVQALVAPSNLGSPRRAVIGWDPNRLAMIVAVLETRAGLKISGNDIFLNFAGGIRIQEPAADVAVAAALIGLAGEIRQVAQPEQRLKEAAKLGFKEAVIPARKKKEAGPAGLRVSEVRHVEDLAEMFAEETKIRSVAG